ncbi:uncharacterized protein LOC125758902 [Rhipicephalus sanguineus]|uniref:uncharacterized protein LOC125758902 n=1 Tax=Rhipicephalus sanguineus TaxID=34632 RepID=UPI0020C3C5D9|nr:uncharacterized protein LOC125758902 [Rhipicephalus sanguineus]
MNYLAGSAGFGPAVSMSTTHLRGRGIRRRSGGSDQRSRDQDIIPLSPMGVMPGPDSPPPSYRESVLIANLQVSFTANNAAPAARNVGDICHMEQDLSPERQDRQVEDSDEQDSCEHIDLDKWSRWPFERWGQWYMYVLMVIIGVSTPTIPRLEL